MLKKKRIFLSTVIGIAALHLAGCKSGSALEPMETRKEAEEETEEKPDQKESEDETDDTPKEVPQLPLTGSRLADFVPEGWELLDSATLDFNEDGISDYVGILQDTSMDITIDLDYRWILFAIVSDGTKGYHLDFQDSSFIHNHRGTVTAEGTSFTIYTEYGTMLRWSLDHPNSSRGTNDDTYTYRDGSWWHTLSERTYGYGDYITEYSRDDWESGVGIRKERSSKFEDIERNYEFGEYENRESIEYDVVYEVALDKPLTLEQIGKQRELSPYGVTDWEVGGVAFAADVTLSEDMVKPPNERVLSSAFYWDENGVLYVFYSGSDTDKGFYYLAMYDRQDKVLSVLAKEESEINTPKLYKGKIYYSTNIVENVTYRTMEGGKEQITEEEAVVGIRLERMNPDGSGKEKIFEYRYLGTELKIMENEMPYYLGIYYEISGDEIIARVNIRIEEDREERQPDLIYRMKTDGNGCKKIGQLPKE